MKVKLQPILDNSLLIEKTNKSQVGHMRNSSNKLSKLIQSDVVSPTTNPMASKHEIIFPKNNTINTILSDYFKAETFNSTYEQFQQDLNDSSNDTKTGTRMDEYQFYSKK